MSYTQEQIEMIIKENEKLKKENKELKEQNNKLHTDKLELCVKVSNQKSLLENIEKDANDEIMKLRKENENIREKVIEEFQSDISKIIEKLNERLDIKER